MGKAGASDPDPVWFGKSFSKEAEVESKTYRTATTEYVVLVLVV